MYPAVASIARMDIEWIKDQSLTRDEIVEYVEDFDGQPPENFEGMLNGGHTAKAVLMGVLRLALRVEALEAAAKN